MTFVFHIGDRLDTYHVDRYGPARCPRPGCWRTASVFVRSPKGDPNGQLLCRPCSWEVGPDPKGAA